MKCWPCIPAIRKANPPLTSSGGQQDFALASGCVGTTAILHAAAAEPSARVPSSRGDTTVQHPRQQLRRTIPHHWIPSSAVVVLCHTERPLAQRMSSAASHKYPMSQRTNMLVPARPRPVGPYHYPICRPPICGALTPFCLRAVSSEIRERTERSTAVARQDPRSTAICAHLWGREKPGGHVA